ncbi:MAG: PLP-dependent aminotransferase family protein [Kineosporiaceae bacterium]|nr:PLP-dependent aminotransferase family protein [Kineosporiaceae bacterium]
MNQTNSRTGSGLDADLTVDRPLAGGSGPAHQRLAAWLRSEINGGRLLPGDRLPPSRALAEQLGASRWVVTEAYDQLKAEGYLTGRTGSATIVAEVAPRPPATPDTPPATPTDPAAVLDLSPALPDLGSFPRSWWRAAITRALVTASDVQLGHPDPAGEPELRRVLADYLRRVRALDGRPDHVQITQGVGNAVWLLCRHLRARGVRRLAVENPCWPRVRRIAGVHDLDVVPVPVDGEGLIVDHLVAADAQQRIDAVVTMPTHQFPTGVPLSPPRRLALLSWAETGNRWIVEDDYDSEFRYDRRPVGALAALAPERVIYLGSVSKTLSPSLHLGWMVVPEPLRAGLDAARDALGALAPALDQLALADLIDSGRYDRHLRRMRRLYQARRLALLAALAAESVPGAAAPSMDAGLHVLWYLPAATDESRLIERSRGAGIALTGLAPCHTGRGRPGLVLGYGNLPEHRAAGVARLLAAAAR